MKTRILYGSLVFALALNLVAGAKIFRQATARAAAKPDAPLDLDLFTIVADRVRSDYVDGAKLNNTDLLNGALKGMVNTLDPHSEFLPPQKYKVLQDDTQGQFGGVGIVITVKDGQLTVVTPMEDTPGFRAGILAGDRLVKIDGHNAVKFTQDEAVKYLRGEPDSVVTVTVFRPSSGVTKELKVTRAVISLTMVKDVNGKKEFPLSADKIGYARLLQFSEKTADELEVALDKLKAQGMRAMILDLRENPGGLLEQAVEVSQKFLPRGQLVVSTEGPNPINNAVHKAEGHGDDLVDISGAPLPLVILVNTGTASAAEIVTGCLQDARRGTVILGEKTFGKGSVQNIIPLDTGAALKLTVAKYYTPSHKVIHEHGIEPDIVVPTTPEEERDLMLKRSPGGVDTLEEKDRERVRNTRDTQLERATDLLKGLMLYAQMDKPEPKPEKVAAK
jgi:carboxyl-terminal processing protease